MKLLYLVVVAVLANTACAEVIEIPRGGYSIDADSTAKAFIPEGYKTLPTNMIFPRVASKNFYLDSVIWKSADPKEDLDSVFSRHAKEARFSVTKVQHIIRNQSSQI